MSDPIHFVTATVCATALLTLPLLLFLFAATVFRRLRKWYARRVLLWLRTAAMADLLKQPQSGLWVWCRDHEAVPVTEAEFARQSADGTFRCPLCGRVPARIWRDCKD